MDQLFRHRQELAKNNKKFRPARHRSRTVSRHLFLERLEQRHLLTECGIDINCLFADAGGYYEYDTNGGDQGHEVPAVSENINAHFTRLTPSGSYPDSVLVNYRLGGIEDGATATPGVDHTLQDGSILIPAGQQGADVPYTIKNDKYSEGEESIVIIITSWTTLIDGDPSGIEYENPGSVPAIITDDDDPELPPDLCPDCSAWSEQPVRSADGTVLMTSTDVSSSAGGTAWGVTRSWTNGEGYAPGNMFGMGTFITEQPQVVSIDNNTAAVIMNGQTSYYFDDPEEDGSFVGRGFNRDTLAEDSGDLVLTQSNGAQYRFYALSNQYYNHQRGQLKSYTEPGGAVINLTYDEDKAILLYAERQSTVNGTNVVERIEYSYMTFGDSFGQVASVTLKRQTDSGDFLSAAKAAYTYHPADGADGNQWDIATVVKSTFKPVGLDLVESVSDTLYYRYYTWDDVVENAQPGYVHGLKYVFSSAALQRLIEAEGSNFNALSDTTVAPYADNYFEYDEDHRVVREIAGGAGSSGGNGQATYAYAYQTSGNTPGPNSWATRFTETLPDNDTTNGITSENIVFTNSRGQVMLKVHHFADTATSTDLKWYTYNRYDADGRAALSVSSPAVTGYSESYAALLDADGQSTDWEFLDDDSGLFTWTTYYDPDDPSPPAGWAPGYVEKAEISQGETGNKSLQSYNTYTSQTAGGKTVYLVAASYEYPTETTNVAAADRLATLYDYEEFYSGTVQVKQQKTTDAAGDETVTVFDVHGRPIWTKDPAGFLNYTEYDQKTGAVVKQIVDVDTTKTGDFTALPTNPSQWQTPSGGGAHLITSYLVDDQGRTTKLTQKTLPADYITYTTYNDAAQETRTYPGWHLNSTSGNYETTGPIVVTRENRALGFTETLTYSFIFTSSYVADNAPNGTEDLGGTTQTETDDVTIQSLSRTYVNNTGQTIQRDDYVTLANIDYVTAKNALHPGTINVDFLATTFEYDSRGRLNRQGRAPVKVGTPPNETTTYRTISRTTYDALGRATGEWIGDSDTVETGTTWSPSNHGHMILIRASQYDSGGVGPGNLTSATETITHNATTYDPTTVRTTAYEYDYRNREKTRTLQDPDGAGSEVSPVYRTEYDNLGRVKRQTDGTGPIDANGNIDVTAIGHYTSYAYDDQNRTTTVTGPDADGNAGTTGDAPQTTTVTNSRGLVETQTDPLGHVTTYEYDGAGRQTKLFPPDPTTGLKNTSLYTLTTYNGASNVVSSADQLGHTTTYAYDLAGRLTKTTYPDPDAGGSQNASEVNYSYTAAGQRLNLTDPAGNTTTWNYDALGHVTSEVISLNNLARNFTYDELGLLTQKSDRLDRVTKYEYNVFDQVIAEKWYETNGTTLVRTISSQYDDAGQLTHSGDVDAASQPMSAAYDYLYDLLGRRTDETQDIANLSDNILYESQYDRNGFRLDLQATIGTTKDFHNVYTPDNLQRLQTLVQDEVSGGNDVAAKRLAFTYNNAGQLDSISRYAAATATNLRVNSFSEYDHAGRLAQLTHTTDTTRPTAGTFGAGALAGHIYTFDAANRISSRESLWRNNTTTQFVGTTTFSYGDDDQLTDEARDWTVDAQWQYDENGNRVQYSNGGFSRSYTTGDMNRITSDGWFTFTHDDEGNITAKASSSTKYEYDWDWRDRLTAVRMYYGSNGTNWSLQWTIHYGYDAMNQLVWRSIGPPGYSPTYKAYSFENGQMNLAFEYYGYLTQRFVWGPQTDQLLIDEYHSAYYPAGEIYYPLADHQQSIQDAAKYITASGATKVVTHRYGDAYGTGGSYSAFEGIYYDGSLFAFTGRYLDVMTGLQWHLNRWYDPFIGRWMSEDPIGFGGDPWNLYRYVANSPTNGTDPSGLQTANSELLRIEKQYSRGGDDEERTYETARIYIKLFAEGHTSPEGCTFDVRLTYFAHITGRVRDENFAGWNLSYGGDIVPLYFKWTPRNTTGDLAVLTGQMYLAKNVRAPNTVEGTVEVRQFGNQDDRPVPLPPRKMGPGRVAENISFNIAVDESGKATGALGAIEVPGPRAGRFPQPLRELPKERPYPPAPNW